MLILLTQCNNCIKWGNLCFIVLIAIIKQKGVILWRMLYCNNLLYADKIDYVELLFAIRNPFNKRFCYKGNNVNEMLLLGSGRFGKLF